MGYRKIEFGYETWHLVCDLLDYSQHDDWLSPKCLEARLEMIIIAGGKPPLVDELTARWHGHTGPINEFDFSESTVVEIPEFVFAKAENGE